MTRQAHRDGFGGGFGGCLPAMTGLVLVLALSIGGIWFAVNAGAGLLLPSIPRDWDAKVGAQVYKQIAYSPQRCRDAPAEHWVREVGELLLAQTDAEPFAYTWSVLNEPTPNAFALPGGFVAVHTGLFELAERPEEVAAVLAHEIVHAEQRHGMLRMLSSFGARIMVGMVLGGTDLAWLAGSGMHLMILSHSREQEEEADRIGRILLVRAGINPDGMATIFEKMARHGGGASALPGWLSSHPDSSERAQRARQGERPKQLISLPKMPPLHCAAATKTDAEPRVQP
jgi:predicted Zn-dependent protease